MPALLRVAWVPLAVLTVGNGNRMLLAFSKQTDTASIRARLRSFDGDAMVKRLARRSAAQVADFEVPAGAVVFTDDFSPVEEITRRMLNED